MKAYQYLTEHDVHQLRSWHRWLNDNRADRAKLRRAQSPEDILLSPAFAHFLGQMPERWQDPDAINLLDAAMVAAVLARVKIDDVKHSFATALAMPKEAASRAAMSELRFQQLQKSRTPEDFFRRISRAVALLGGKANIACLTDNILQWLLEYRYAPARRPAQRLAVRWATDYYTALKD